MSHWRREDGKVHGWIKWGTVVGGIMIVVGGKLALDAVAKGGELLAAAAQADRDHPAIVENSRARHEQNAINQQVLVQLKYLNRHSHTHSNGRPR